MELEILKSEVFKEVEKRSSLEAAGLPEAFEQVWASEYEGGFLETYWIEACEAVVQLFKRYLRNRTVEHTLLKYDRDEKLELSVQMPARYNELLDGSVTTDVKMMMAASVLGRWLSVQAPERAEKYTAEAADYAAGLKQKLFYRNDPLLPAAAESVPDDVPVALPGGCDELLIMKGTDRLILRQYEKCDHCVEPRGNHGRCRQCGPCHRP